MSVEEALTRIDSACVTQNVKSVPGYRENFPTILLEFFSRDYFCADVEGVCRSESDIAFIIDKCVTRLEQSYFHFLPWLERAAGDLGGRIAIEIGCGTGSSTVALASKFSAVKAVDIDKRSLNVTSDLLESFSLRQKVSIQEVTADWITGVTDWDDLLNANGRPAVYVMYALLEHLIPMERVILLRRISERLKPGDIIATFETPNRLSPVNWHGPDWLFQWVLPIELQHLNARNDQKAGDLVRDFTEELATKLYRDGTGVSFHEFSLAFDLSEFEILADSNTTQHPTWFKSSPKFETALREVLSSYKRSIPAGFACSSLDFVMIKK